MKYYRLSLEDREEGESGSITNQRRLVEGYLQGHRDLSAMETNAALAFSKISSTEISFPPN